MTKSDVGVTEIYGVIRIYQISGKLRACAHNFYQALPSPREEPGYEASIICALYIEIHRFPKSRKL